MQNNIKDQYPCVAQFISKKTIEIMDICEQEILEENEATVWTSYYFHKGLRDIYNVVAYEWCRCERCLSELKKACDFEEKKTEIREKMLDGTYKIEVANLLMDKLMKEFRDEEAR